MATHSSILAWRIPWTEEPGGLQPRGRKEPDTSEPLHFHFHCFNTGARKIEMTCSSHFISIRQRCSIVITQVCLSLQNCINLSLLHLATLHNEHLSLSAFLLVIFTVPQTLLLESCQSLSLLKVKVKSLSHVRLETPWTVACLCDPVDSSPPGSSLHGILQARVLEWVAISFSRGSSQCTDQTWVSCIPGNRFNL